MNPDLQIIERELSDGSSVFDVMFTPLMPAGEPTEKITLHCSDAAGARWLVRALDEVVVGVEVETTPAPKPPYSTGDRVVMAVSVAIGVGILVLSVLERL